MSAAGMRHALISVLLLAFAAVSLTGCSEKPPRPDPEDMQAYNVENGPSPLYERTLNQGASQRMEH